VSEMRERNCAVFITDDWEPEEDWMKLMRCPACKGWLPSDWPIGVQFQCKKCGAVLETLPTIPEDAEDEEEDTDYEWGGNLCVVPDVAVKIIKVDYPIKRIKKMKKKTSLRAMGRTWTRRVWEDEEGRYVEIWPLGRITLDDPRILRIVEDEIDG